MTIAAIWNGWSGVQVALLNGRARKALAAFGAGNTCGVFREVLGYDVAGAQRSRGG